MVYKGGLQENPLLTATKLRLEDLREDYKKARDLNDRETMNLLIEQARRTKVALEVMENVIKTKLTPADAEFDRNVEEVFG